jgi:hypothetical protein
LDLRGVRVIMVEMYVTVAGTSERLKLLEVNLCGVTDCHLLMYMSQTHSTACFIKECPRRLENIAFEHILRTNSSRYGVFIVYLDRSARDLVTKANLNRP